MRQATRLGLLVLSVTASRTTADAAERFALDVPGRPEISSTAVLEDDGELVIIDFRGEAFRYFRVPELDTAGGGYVGYYSAEAGKYLRWPRDGAGQMLQLHDLTGRWERTRMTVRPLTRPLVLLGGEEAPPPRPVRPAVRELLEPQSDPFARSRVRREISERRTRTGPMHVALVPLGEDTLEIAHIDAEGRLVFDRGFADRWSRTMAELAEPLVPGAPLAMIVQPRANTPLVYTVAPDGRLVETVGGGPARVVSDQVKFTVRSHVAVAPLGERWAVFAVDEEGRIVQIDP
ncbi:MAG: hypothetical protein ACREIV_00995, partial [Planctomycetaceae bacterium]